MFPCRQHRVPQDHHTFLCCFGSRFADSFSLAVLTWRLICIAIIELLVIRPLQIFAHAMTAQLLCHVWNCVAISILEFSWEPNRISIKWNGDGYIEGVSWAVHFRLYIYKILILLSRDPQSAPGPERANGLDNYHNSQRISAFESYKKPDSNSPAENNKPPPLPTSAPPTAPKPTITKTAVHSTLMASPETMKNLTHSRWGRQLFSLQSQLLVCHGTFSTLVQIINGLSPI